MKYLWTEDTGAGLHFWKLVNQLFFNDALVVESKESNQGLLDALAEIDIKEDDNQNYILREEEINARIKKFKEKGYSIDRLIQLAVKEKYDVVGEVLAQFYCDGVFDEKVFCSLMKNDKEGKYV